MIQTNATVELNSFDPKHQTIVKTDIFAIICFSINSVQNHYCAMCNFKHLTYFLSLYIYIINRKLRDDMMYPMIFHNIDHLILLFHYQCKHQSKNITSCTLTMTFILKHDYNPLQTLTVIHFLLVISYKIKHFNA